MSTSTLDPTAPAAAGGLTARLRASRWTPLPIILAGTFMVVLDFFIVNVALPSMQARLHASDGAVEWVVAGYSLTAAVLLVAAGRLGDRFGRRRAVAAGLALFTLGSAACGLAPDAGVLVVGRFVQGGAGALLMPNVLTLIGVMYDGADRARALAVYGMTMGLAAVSGQLIGGLLLAANPGGAGWRSVFLINLPVGALALAMIRLVPESRVGREARIDGVGTALVTAAVTAIVLPLVEGRAHGWPLWTWLSLAAAPCILALFAVHQRALARRGRSARAIVPAELFAARGFAAGVLAQLVFWVGQASFFLVLALYLQQGRHLTPLRSGLVFTLLAAPYLVASLRAPTLTLRHGRRVLAAGALTLAAGHALLLGAVAESSSVMALTPGLMLVGVGMGLGIPSLATLVMAGMRPEHAGATAGVLATAQNVGNAIGVAAIGALFFGAAGDGIAGAFQLSVAVLACVLVLVAGLSRLMPAGPGVRS